MHKFSAKNRHVCCDPAQNRLLTKMLMFHLHQMKKGREENICKQLVNAALAVRNMPFSSSRVLKISCYATCTPTRRKYELHSFLIPCSFKNETTQNRSRIKQLRMSNSFELTSMGRHGNPANGSFMCCVHAVIPSSMLSEYSEPCYENQLYIALDPGKKVDSHFLQNNALCHGGSTKRVRLHSRDGMRLIVVLRIHSIAKTRRFEVQLKDEPIKESQKVPSSRRKILESLLTH